MRPSVFDCFGSPNHRYTSNRFGAAWCEPPSPCGSFTPHLVGKMVIQAAHECSTQPTTPQKNKSLNLKCSHIESQLEEKPNIFPQLNQKSSDLFFGSYPS